MTGTAVAERETATTPELLERVVIGGDLSKLTATDRLTYYRAVCESVGLNPLTRPFEYLVLSGKTVLYARRDATDQLRKLHGVSVAIVAREQHGDVYAVTARATDRGGRHDESVGAVPTSGLRGELLANALMKAETKAKRRVTLSICGLGMLDETEIETISDAKPLPEPGPVAPLSVQAPVQGGQAAGAPSQDWIEACGQAQSLKALQHLWRTVTAPETWGSFTPDEQTAITTAKDAAKTRLTGAA